MKKKPILQKLEHSPNLNTVLMVEHILQTSDDSLMTIPELKRKLPKQVNHNTLKVILEYLEQSKKIAVTMKGITWVYNPSRKLQDLIRRSYAYLDDFPNI